MFRMLRGAFSLLLSTLVLSLELKGSIDITSNSNFVYLGKFCYDAPVDPNATSTLNYWITPTNVGGSTQYLAIYDDQSNSWPMAMKAIKENNCLGALSYSKKLVAGTESTTAIPLVPNTVNSDIISVNEHVVPRWWYVAYVNCEGSVACNYNISFTQYDGSPWSYQASGLLGLYVFFSIYFSLLLAAALYLRLKSTYRHQLSTIYLASLVLQTVSLLSYVIYFASFQGDGLGVPFFERLAAWIQEMGVVLFIAVFLVLSSGYTTELWQERKLFILLSGGYLFINIILLIWYFTVYTSSWDTTFMYDSAAGIILMIFRLCLGVFNVVVLRTTHMMEARLEKKQFYVHTGVAASLWLLLFPALMLVFCALPSYYQMKMQLGLLVVFNAIAYTAIAYLFRPSLMNEMYPTAAPERAPSSDFGKSLLRDSNADLYTPPTPAEIEAATTSGGSGE